MWRCVSFCPKRKLLFNRLVNQVFRNGCVNYHNRRKMSNVTLKFSSQLAESDPQKNPVLIIGRKQLLTHLKYCDIKYKLHPRVTEEVYKQAIESLRPSSTDTWPLYLNHASLACLPNSCSRHNTPSQAHALTKLVKGFSSGSDEYIVIVCEYKDAFASACAVARAFPLYNRKAKYSGSGHTVTVEFVLLNADGHEATALRDSDVECLTVAAEGIRLAAKIVDMPCSEMNTDAFLQEIHKVGDALGIKPEVIRGQDLAKRGFGGIYSVGQAAEHPPALAILSHTDPDAEETIAWVGKGIVYDTGGLCIKSKTSMAGMKRDCGGAAAILGAFYVAVKLGFQENLHAIFCLAENAVGPKAVRPDDIITMYSGRTVEINNTDAEGRLVLGDGVAYAEKDLNATTILDMATLTGAQGTATGRYHAALLTNSEEWEKAAVKAGQISGDLVHPVPYTPEIHFNEFASNIADMKNSVADRSNAQPSCAGLFIGAQIGFDYEGYWIHVDMASPVHCGDRATGYGVALLTTLFGHASDNSLLQMLSPHMEAEGNGMESASKKIRLE